MPPLKKLRPNQYALSTRAKVKGIKRMAVPFLPPPPASCKVTAPPAALARQRGAERCPRGLGTAGSVPCRAAGLSPACHRAP